MIILDRFEGNLAVLETEDGIQTVSRDCIPTDATEGDVLTLLANGSYALDAEETAHRKSQLQARFQRLIRRDRSLFS